MFLKKQTYKKNNIIIILLSKKKYIIVHFDNVYEMMIILDLLKAVPIH